MTLASGSGETHDQPPAILLPESYRYKGGHHIARLHQQLVVCRNPEIAAEPSDKRETLLAATERDLSRIRAAVARKRDPQRGTADLMD